MKEQKIIDAAIQYVQKELGQDSSGHDWFHIERVTRLAKRIAEMEGANSFICQMAALLHDLIDEKLYPSTEEAKNKVISWLVEQEIEQESRNYIMEIISTISYSGGYNAPMKSLEGKVVQDADRLDALGAIGIARTFAYAGWKGEPMYDPDLPPRATMSKQQYRQQKSTALNHFHEKLYKLKDLMNTSYGRKLAEQRERLLYDFEAEFLQEWHGEEVE